MTVDDLEIDEIRYTLDTRADTSPYPGFAAVTVTNGRSAALAPLSPTMTLPYLPGPPGVRPALVRRAAEYIEAHAAQPLTVVRIAAACEVGPRALQAAFQRHHGQSPIAFLRAVRLRRAHRELTLAAPGQTVAGTARRWGWAHPGRFARAYREAYGCHPGDTLRGAGVASPAERSR
ncbi:helix-turn-helix transcriptional regulator [Micromonospora sp. NPDC049282]|uniref:helix-turn-helix transcriptional regulator n=1 Tax=Micromonospora sp. NPDC049282 TaxID=3364269 RepID=UPI0037195562